MGTEEGGGELRIRCCLRGHPHPKSHEFDTRTLTTFFLLVCDTSRLSNHTLLLIELSSIPGRVERLWPEKRIYFSILEFFNLRFQRSSCKRAFLFRL
jgi:hypothetical protein